MHVSILTSFPQIESLRGTIRFLRSENSFLKGQDLLKEFNSLPQLPELVDPSVDSASSSEVDSDEERSELSFSAPPPTLRSLTTATKVLYRDVMTFSSTPRVVDLSVLNGRKDGKVGWISQRKTPEHQVWERKQEAEKLEQRLKGLTERTEDMAGRSGGFSRPTPLSRRRR